MWEARAWTTEFDLVSLQGQRDEEERVGGRKREKERNSGNQRYKKKWMRKRRGGVTQVFRPLPWFALSMLSPHYLSPGWVPPYWQSISRLPHHLFALPWWTLPPLWCVSPTPGGAHMAPLCPSLPPFWARSLAGA